MKSTLKSIKQLKILRRNEKLLPNCTYILSSESVAQNTYFETKRDIVRAHKMINRHLTNIMDIVDYLFTPSGWMMVVTVKKEKEILENLKQKNYLSKKIKTAICSKNISVLISECMRYSISGMARISNRRNKRKGTLVRCNFSRYIFEHYDICKKVMRKMKSEQIKLCHQRRRYRPSLHWYDEAGEFGKKGDVFLCTKNYRKCSNSGCIGEKCVYVIENKIDVLHKTIINTFLTYFPTKNTTPPHKNQQSTHSITPLI